eukprot:Colp12_sorted_trinity150504_noHs@17939
MAENVDRRPIDVPAQYWGINNKLYDLEPFFDRHPGGRYFLERCRGLDISIAYASIHRPSSDTYREKLLQKYELKEVEIKRLDGSKGLDWPLGKDCFYSELRREVYKQVKPTTDQWLFDACMVSALIAYAYTMYCYMIPVFGNVSHFTWVGMAALSILNGHLRAILFGGGHSYIHTRRRELGELLVDLSLTSSFRWKRTHVVVHHSFTNQDRDIDHQSLWLVFRSWAFFDRWYYVVLNNLIRRFKEGLLSPIGADTKPPLRYMIARAYLFVEPLTSLYMGTFGWWLLSLLVYNIHFQSMLLLNHYNEECQLNGKEFDDWGIHQIMTTNDFKITGSEYLDVLLGVGVNLHTAHHLFPTFNPFANIKVDQVIWQMCKKHGIKRRPTRYLWVLWPELIKSLLLPQLKLKK